VFYYSPDRRGEHPGKHLAGYTGIMQADGYAGFNTLYLAGHKPGPIIEAACWAHARRKFFELAQLRKAPIGIEAVRRIDQLFATRHLSCLNSSREPCFSRRLATFLRTCSLSSCSLIHCGIRLSDFDNK